MTKKEIEVIKSKVENKDIIYFDCFDTIVYRKYSTKYVFYRLAEFLVQEYSVGIATVYKGNIIKNLIMDCQSYTKYRPNETTGGIFVSWRRKEELPTGA